MDTGAPPGRPFPALRRGPGVHASRDSPCPSSRRPRPRSPRRWRGGKPGPPGEPGQLQPPSHLVPAAAGGGNFLPGRLRTGPSRATSGFTRGREGTAAVPPPRAHRGARRVPGWERGKPCLGIEPRHGSGEVGRARCSSWVPNIVQTPANGTSAVQPQCREERGWREARGAQTYQAWNTERRKKTGRSLADMVRTALAR